MPLKVKFFRQTNPEEIVVCSFQNLFAPCSIQDVYSGFTRLLEVLVENNTISFEEATQIGELPRALITAELIKE